MKKWPFVSFYLPPILIIMGALLIAWDASVLITGIGIGLVLSATAFMGRVAIAVLWKKDVPARKATAASILLLVGQFDILLATVHCVYNLFGVYKAHGIDIDPFGYLLMLHGIVALLAAASLMKYCYLRPDLGSTRSIWSSTTLPVGQTP